MALEGWEEWKETLSQAVNVGNMLGLGEEEIRSIACRLGDFLAQNVNPTHGEHRVLKELWQVADSREKGMLAGLVTKLVSSGRR